jgi:hypothetical protein
LRRIKGLNITCKNPKRKQKKNALDIGFGNDFLDMT